MNTADARLGAPVESPIDLSTIAPLRIPSVPVAFGALRAALMDAAPRWRELADEDDDVLPAAAVR